MNHHPIHNHFLVALVAILALLTAMPAAAQYRRRSMGSGDNYHFLYVSGSAGYDMLQTNVSEMTTTGSWGGLVGLGYEFRLNGFWLSVGPQISFHNSSIALDPYTWTPKTDSRFATRTFLDDQGKEIMPRYEVTQHDEVRWTFLDVPVMLGYYTHGFYFGAGAKVSYCFNSTVESRGDYIFSAQYVLYGENSPYYEVGHGYGKYTYPRANQYAEKVNLKPGIALLGEVGYDILSSVTMRGGICHVLKVGFYFEYGLSSLISQSTGDNHYDLTTTDLAGRIDARYLDVHPYLQSSLTQNHRVLPCYTGLKITYLIGGSRTARNGFHKGCQCYN